MVAWPGIQLYKKHWFNDEGCGIHFETWVSEKELKALKLPFVLHVLHQPNFPGTQQTSLDFVRQWRELSEPNRLIAEWPGYKAARIRLLKGSRKFDADDLATAITAEFTRVHVLGTYIDQVLEKLLA